MSSGRLIFLFTLVLNLGLSLPCWSIGSSRPWGLEGDFSVDGKTNSAQKTAQERRRAELHEELRNRTSDADEEMVDVNEEEDISQLTLNHFKTALETFPDATRFVLKKISDGSVVLIPEDADFTDPSKVALENKIIIQAFELILQTEFPRVDFSHFFENENFSASSLALGANKIKEILDCAEQAESISFRRNFLPANSTTSFALPQEKRTAGKIKSWNWRSAILPIATFFLNCVAKTKAQPFAHQTLFGCPNGTEMGIVWEHFSSLQVHNASQNRLTFIPPSCVAAEHFYHQAQDAAEKVSQICFQNLEHPNNSTLQQEWENAFLHSIPSKEHWMLAEASCQGELAHLKSLQLPHNIFVDSIQANQHRQEEWTDAARWHPSVYTKKFQPDLHEYPYACVIDAAEKEGPEEGLKTRWIIARGADQFPYTRLESVFNTSTGELLEQSAMGGNYIIATLPQEETPESLKKKLEYLDPDITLREASPYDPDYFLEFKKVSLRFLPKILEECNKVAISCNFDSIGSSTASAVSTAMNENASHNISPLRNPNDINYTDQTNLKSIQAPQAWTLRHSSSHHIITVIDSGIHPHEDLNQNMWNNSKLKEGYTSYEHEHGVVADSSFNITPLDNHGTHCGGIIGAVGNNRLGIAGIVWNTALMFCKATSLRFKKIDWHDIHVKACIEHAMDHNASVISASYRDLKPTPKTLVALTRARNAGIIVVVPSGNDAKNLDTSSVYPASYAKSPNNPTGLDNIVVVGAVDDHDQWAPFSNYGSQTVHLAAPGVDVLSTVVHNGTSFYERMNGTSMAAPHVAGVLALMKEHFPEKPYTWLIEKLLNATDFLPLLNGNKTIYGRLNAARALEPIAVPQSEDQACHVPTN